MTTTLQALNTLALKTTESAIDAVANVVNKFRSSVFGVFENLISDLVANLVAKLIGKSSCAGLRRSVVVLVALAVLILRLNSGRR